LSLNVHNLFAKLSTLPISHPQNQYILKIFFFYMRIKPSFVSHLKDFEANSPVVFYNNKKLARKYFILPE